MKLQEEWTAVHGTADSRGNYLRLRYQNEDAQDDRDALVVQTDLRTSTAFASRL